MEMTITNIVTHEVPEKHPVTSVTSGYWKVATDSLSTPKKICWYTSSSSYEYGRYDFQ